MGCINEDIEDIEYYNCDVYAVSDCYVPEQTITSVDIFKYSNQKSIRSIFDKYHRHIQEIHRYMWSNIGQNITTEKYEHISTLTDLELAITNSPVLDVDVVTYRGISGHLKHNGDSDRSLCVDDIVPARTFTFWSLDQSTAKMYVNDTSRVYQKPHNIRQSQFGTLMKMVIPKGIHMLDVSYFDHGINKVYNQLLLSHQHNFRVIDIKQDISIYSSFPDNFITPIQVVTLLLN